MSITASVVDSGTILCKVSDLARINTRIPYLCLYNSFIMVGSVPTILRNKAEGELLLASRREVAQLLGWKSLGFPGAQPVSYAARH